MTRIILAIALVLASFSGAWATRVINQPEGSFELSLADVTMPENATGSVSFKSCALCRTATHQVTQSTRYFVDGAEVTFDDFLLGVATLSNPRSVRQSTFVGVFVDKESQRVNRLVVNKSKK